VRFEAAVDEAAARDNVRGFTTLVTLNRITIDLAAGRVDSCRAELHRLMQGCPAKKRVARNGLWAAAVRLRSSKTSAWSLGAMSQARDPEPAHDSNLADCRHQIGGCLLPPHVSAGARRAHTIAWNAPAQGAPGELLARQIGHAQPLVQQKAAPVPIEHEDPARALGGLLRGAPDRRV
jgi:hypothetical protein